MDSPADFRLAEEQQNLLRAWLRAPGAAAGIEQFIDLNTRPLDLMHPRYWPEALQDRWAAQLVSNPRSASLLNRRLYELWGWKDWLPWELDDTVRQVLLLSTEELDGLLFRAAVLRASALIRRTIGGDAIKRLRACIPPGLMTFARFEAASFRPRLPDAYEIAAWESDLSVQFTIAGLELLCAAFVDQPEAVRQRIEKKLPLERTIHATDGESGEPALLRQILSQLLARR